MELAPPPPIRGELKLRRPNAVWSCMHLETGFEAAAPRPPASTDALSASGHLSTRAWGASPLCRDLQWDAWWGQPTPAVVVSAMTEAIHGTWPGEQRRSLDGVQPVACRDVRDVQRRAEACRGQREWTGRVCRRSSSLHTATPCNSTPFGPISRCPVPAPRRLPHIHGLWARSNIDTTLPKSRISPRFALFQLLKGTHADGKLSLFSGLIFF
jgi:hypothetical protein